MADDEIVNQINLENRYTELARLLRSERNESGFWSGQLSSSALATAVSIVSLKINGDDSDKESILIGSAWLQRHINSDGGFGDTPESISNVSTSLLCYGAVYFCRD